MPDQMFRFVTVIPVTGLLKSCDTLIAYRSIGKRWQLIAAELTSHFLTSLGALLGENKLQYIIL